MRNQLTLVSSLPPKLASNLLLNTMSQKWTSKIQWPRDNYILRCTEEIFGASKESQNPMLTLKFEVDSPEEVNVAGELYNVAGARTTGYYVTQVMNEDGTLDEEKTANAQKRVRDLYEKFGLPSDNINFENPELGFKGKLQWALLYADEQQQRKSPTKEQLAKGVKQGDVIKHPITGVPLIAYYPKIDQFFGLATQAANKPF